MGEVTHWEKEILRLRGELQKTRDQRDAAILDAENLEVDLRAMRRQKKALQRQLDERYENSKFHDEALGVFHYWAATCRPTSSGLVFASKRKKAVIDRLREGHKVEALYEAIDGAAVDAYVNEKGKKFDELELICRDETTVDSFRTRAQAHARRLEVMSPAQVVYALTQKLGEPLHDEQLDVFRFQCPSCWTWGDEIDRALEVRVNGSVQIGCTRCGAGLEQVKEHL